MHKTCSSCKATKHVDEFGKQKSKPDGLRCYCRKCDSDRRREWSAANKERQKEIHVKHRATKDFRQKARTYRKHLRDTSPTFKYRDNLSRRINTALKRGNFGPKTTNLPDIIGCSLDDLASHLMLTAIDRYGYWLANEPYHIDHIVPIATARTIEDINLLNHFKNLQLLTPADNLTKGCRL